MECPKGCGDMEQLVSLSNVLDPETLQILKTSKQVYERCHECGHEETIDLQVYDETLQPAEKEESVS